MNKSLNYFYGIDFLRWFAAFGVVLYHYSLHFRVNEINYNPFLNYLIINREFAQNFVWLFWGISGFIFTNIYIHKQVSFQKFVIARFARLYPLHLITLISVMILQYISLKNFNYTQENYLNDIYHFILHLFFASDWGLQKYWSFNVPVWSISIEVPIYFLFFISLLYVRKFKIIFSILIAVFFYYFFPKIFNFDLNKWQSLALFNFKTCIFYFFFGSAIYFFYTNFKKFKKILFFLSLILILISIFFLNYDFKSNISIYFPSTFILIQSLILFFACSDDILKNCTKKIFLLSNTSYSIYLIHFPIQLIILIIFDKYSLDLKIFSNFLIFFLFLLLLQLISFCSYLYFENPIRIYINSFYKKT